MNTAAFTCLIGDSRGFRLDPHHGPVTIGRNGEASIQLIDPWVSRQHCRISIEGEQLHLSDLGSTHGTFVNREPVQNVTLRNGDEVQIGLNLFRVAIKSVRHTASSVSHPCAMMEASLVES